MADEFGHIGKTLEDIKRQIAAKVEEAARLLVTVNTLEGMMGMEPSALADYIGEEEAFQTPAQGQQPSLLPSRAVNPQSVGRGGSVRSIKPDQFLGQLPLDAAKRYLSMVGHAVHFDEIADAVQRGGAATKGSDWRDKLEMSLLKSVYEVVKVQDKTYGLVSFYSEEQIQGLRGTRRRPEPKGKGKRGKRGPRREKTVKAPKAAANSSHEKVAAKVKPTAENVATADPESKTDHVH